MAYAAAKQGLLRTRRYDSVNEHSGNVYKFMFAQNVIIWKQQPPGSPPISLLRLHIDAYDALAWLCSCARQPAGSPGKADSRPSNGGYHRMQSHGHYGDSGTTGEAASPKVSRTVSRARVAQVSGQVRSFIQRHLREYDDIKARWDERAHQQVPPRLDRPCTIAKQSR